MSMSQKIETVRDIKVVKHWQVNGDFLEEELNAPLKIARLKFSTATKTLRALLACKE